MENIWEESGLFQSDMESFLEQVAEDGDEQDEQEEEQDKQHDEVHYQLEEGYREIEETDEQLEEDKQQAQLNILLLSHCNRQRKQPPARAQEAVPARIASSRDASESCSNT